MYEGLLCVCCMSTEDLVQLFGSRGEGDAAENYANMLAVCLRIQLSETDGHYSICTLCVSKLKDCLTFKVMTLKSISILSSVDLTELLTKDELQVLGLNKIENSHELSYNKNNEESEPELCSEQNDAELSKMKDNIKKIQAKLSNCDTEVLDVVDKENTDKGASPVTSAAARARETGARRGRGRGRGRPRLRSPDGLPYRLDKHELSCRECDETFPNHITLKVHYNTHYGRHECTECSKRFVSRGGLAKHALAHRTGPFHCDVCQQEFNKMNTLLSHKRYKHGARAAYVCGACPLRLRTLHARLAHRARAHGLDARTHRCQYCGQSFRHSGERAKHISTHHEVRFVECTVCGARLRRSSLREHLRRHQGERVRNSSKAVDQRRFACRLCGKAFSQKHTLLYHIGSHARRGLYAGPPGELVVDRARPMTDKGLLSDVDSDHSEPDDSDLSDHTQQLLDARAPDSDDEIQYIHYRVSSDDEPPPRAPCGNGHRASDAHEIRIDLGFNVPSDFEE